MPIYDRPNTPPTFECLHEEAARQKLPPELLLAVMRTEGGRMGQFVRNNNGSYDVGPMQINTTWIAKLAKKANTTSENIVMQLAYHGCWNMAVGAWILRSAIDESPNDFWRGVGYYNSHNIKYWPSYSRRVQAHYQKIVAASRKQGDRAAPVDSSYAALATPAVKVPVSIQAAPRPRNPDLNYARFSEPSSVGNPAAQYYASK